MADNSISTRTIVNRNVTSGKIAVGAILTERFKDNTLDGKVVKDNTLNGTKLINLSLDGVKSKIELLVA